VTEDQWNGCTDASAMLLFLRNSLKGNNRKLRLFACACCRDAGHLLTHESLRQAAETAERYADGQARYSEMVQVTKAVDWFSCSASNTDSVVSGGIWHLTTMGVWWNLSPLRRTDRILTALSKADRGLRLQQARLLRDIFFPFRPVTIASSCLPPQAVTLAQVVYQERSLPDGRLDNARLAVLADLLEAASCTDALLLGHLRGKGPHVRGCFALDAVLGKA